MNLVVGATGLLGTEICRQLRAKNLPVRALVRGDSPASQALAAMGAELVRGDLKDISSLEAACRGVTAVITTANTVTRRGKGDSAKATDRDGNLSLIDAAKKAGVG